MSQPTQEQPSVYTTRGHDTPLQARACNPFRGRLSISALDDVQCLPDDRARQPGATTTDHPRAQACPNPPRGLTMHGLPQEMLEGRPETSISVTPLFA
jgi:hypothetical protein